MNPITKTDLITNTQPNIMLSKSNSTVSKDTLAQNQIKDSIIWSGEQIQNDHKAMKEK